MSAAKSLIFPRNRKRIKLAHKPATKQEQKKEYVELGQETIISQPTSLTVPMSSGSDTL